MPAIALVVEISTHPGQRDAFVARLSQHRANVLAHEPGCERFEILLAEEEAEWRDRVSGWRALGLTHLCLRTLGGGLNPQQHMDKLGEIMDQIPDQ